jgi:two-component system response regulator AtoC
MSIVNNGDVSSAIALDHDGAFALSPAMRIINGLLDQVAPTDATVLVWGESGVGKELVARALHARSLRKDCPFVKVNCAALPSELLESELFGYDRGAFTGAHRSKPGKFEVANTGTIFLDEIGEMPLVLQAKLLQVLQDGEFSRLGSRGDVRVDVRIVVATNKDLRALAAQGAFREDLFYRLNVVNIHVPPLRKRREEIPVLAAWFLDQYARRYARVRPSLSSDTLGRFGGYHWPGNVRELENVVKRIVVLGDETLAIEELLKVPEERVSATVPSPDLPCDVGEGAPRKPGATMRGGTAAGSEGQVMERGPHATPKRVLAETALGVGLEHSGVDPEGGVEELGLRKFARRAAGRAERRALEDMLTQARWRKGEAARRLKISYKTLLRKMREHGFGP